jgi:hypothetical protein
MNNILAKLVLFLSLISLSYAQSFFDMIDTNATNVSVAKSIFLSYEEVPTKVYIGEIFPIKVKAIIANNDFDELYSQFMNATNTNVINPESKWQWLSDNIFYNTFYLKVNALDSTLPTLTLDIYKSSKLIDQGSLPPSAPNIIKLNKTKEFSNVLAHELHIKKNKTSRFDDKNLFIVLEIEAKYSNLGDFKLSWVEKDGIDTLDEGLPYSKIFYYAIIPNYIKKFDFTYFDILKNKFVKISIPIVISDDKVSTQDDLNPGDSSIQIYKDSAYGILTIVFLLLFIKKRRMIYMIFIFVLIALFIYGKNPFNDMKVEKNTNVKILPTQKSTIFYVVPRTLYVQRLGTKDDYIKILLPNGKIGWIKDDNVIKN